ncbi:MAG: AMP-binding protein [Burkholderiales bacterium]|jgi:long-chain acyl-CoA synthetase|nr:AMP-binding protein [Burkholderiales bacterium]
MNPKPWLKQYPPDVPAEIVVDPAMTIHGVLTQTVARHPQRPSFTCMGHTLTYKRLDELSQAFAGWLQSVGVQKGARVALMMPNILQYPICLFGLLRAGCVAVNVNPLYKARELQYQLNDSGAEIIVVVENYARTLETVLDKTQVRRVVITSIGEELGFKGIFIDFALRHLMKKIKSYSLPNSILFSQTLKIGNGKFKPVEVVGDDIAFLQYTGGTTGVSKGAILTHTNMVANQNQVLAWVAPYIDLQERQVMITPLPLYHVFSLLANCLLMTTIGAESILITDPRNIPKMVAEIGKYRFSVISGVNTLYNALLNNADFRKIDFSNLKITLGGGMSIQRSVADRWREVTGNTLSEAYGLTETSPAVAVNPFNLDAYNGSIGVPIPSTDLVLRDENGKNVALGEVGEIGVAGPQVTKGYWQRDDETQRAFSSDGYFMTGDLARMDENGFLQLVERKKDMILVSGYNVYPNEIEAVASSHPGVLECAAVGIPNERTGEKIKLYVVKKNSELAEDELIKYCRTNLAGYKVPRAIEFRDELPKSHVGKILRRVLREDAIKQEAS